MNCLKILVVGDIATGKSSLIRRLVYNSFQPSYRATIGCELGIKVVQVKGVCIKVQLWDVAGQERLGGISRLYCRDANGVIVVADVTRKATVTQAERWISQINENVRHPDGAPIPALLCLNKVDLMEIGDAVKQLGEGKIRLFKKWFLTSAKTGNNVNEALVDLIEDVLTRNKEMIGREKMIKRKTLKDIRKNESVHRDCPC